MSNGSATSSADPRSAARGASLRRLLRRAWEAIIRNRGLVLAIVVTSLFQAFFTKAPLVLIKPVGDALGSMLSGDAEGKITIDLDGAKDGGGVEVADSGSIARVDWGQVVLDAVDSFSVWVCDLFGIVIDGAHAAATTTMVGCAVLAALAGLIGALFVYLSMVTSRYFAAKVVVDLRNEVASHLVRLPLRYYGKQRMGELISELTNNTQVISRSATLVADHVVTDPAMILINILILAMYEPIALWILLPAIPLMALPIIRLGRKVHKRSGSSLAAMGDATESMNQMLSGIKTIKTFQLEDRRLQEFSASNDLYLHRTKRMLQAKGRSQAVVFAGYQVAFAVLLILWATQGTSMTIGDLAIILVPISTTYTHVKRVSRAYNTMMESLGALDAVEAILGESHDEALATRSQCQRLEQVEGRVAMEGVEFSYGSARVLHGIDFSVEPGTSVALVGPSGAGKSTILDLLVCLHAPTAGRILIDGRDLAEIDVGSYRRHTAVVGQQPFLFNSSVFDNIECGRPGATAEDVQAAATAAQIHDFVMSLPGGYETVVGERGSNLSGGQMQRIAIARAMVRDPAILFLDEAMSALDSESEEAVQEAISNLMRGRTSFAVAHRLSTIRDSDLILVLDGGRILESGDHEALIEQDGLYRRLVDLQRGSMPS